MTQQVRAELVSLLPRLRRFAYGLTGSLDDGDDLVQSAAQRALTRLDQFQQGTRLDSWMYRIVQNLWIDQRRARQVRPEAGMEPAELEALAVGDAERELNSRLTLAAVQRAVGELSADQRAVLLLVCVEGQSYKAAADVLEDSAGHSDEPARTRPPGSRASIGQRTECNGFANERMMAMAKQSKPWVESMLVAYVDKQLEPAQMAAVEEIIREDPEARAIAAVLRRSAAAVKSAYDQPLREPVPARLLATVGLEEATMEGDVVPRALPSAGWSARQSRRWRHHWRRS